MQKLSPGRLKQVTCYPREQQKGVFIRSLTLTPTQEVACSLTGEAGLAYM